jgi:hypothetical protein
LRKLVGLDGWRVILRDGASFLNNFIEHFITELHLSEGNNLAVFYDQRPPLGWAQLLKRAREYHRGGNLFVAAISRSSDKDIQDLEELWERDFPGLKLFIFKGAFEWLYAFIRLAQASGPATLAQQVNLTHRDITWVTPTNKTNFDTELPGGDVSLLVTSAFTFSPASETSSDVFEERALQDDAEDEAEYCLDAAKEIGGILSHLPFYVRVKVLHCITAEELPNFLEGHPFTAWIHLGHGDERGLRENPATQSASSQRWLDCFNDYERGLQLVIFSACESADLARSFAESGLTQVAIGFENQVLTQATRTLSGKVMPAALQSGNRQKAILQAFLEAVIGLHRRSYEENCEDRYYSDAAPRAFAVTLTS